MFRYNRTSKHLEIILVTHGERKDLCPNAETWVFFAHSCSCILHWWQLPIHTWWNPDLVIRSCCVFNPQIVASTSFSDWKIACVKMLVAWHKNADSSCWWVVHNWYRKASLICDIQSANNDGIFWGNQNTYHPAGQHYYFH